MSWFPRRLKLFLFMLVIVSGGYLAFHFVSSFGREIPPELSEARLQGAIVSQQIVDLSNRAAADLERINVLHRDQNFEDALDLTLGVVKQSQEVRDQAVQLSSELERMTRALSAVNSFAARQAALEAISDRLALINRIINYTSYLSQVLELLRSRFEGNTIGLGRVQILIDQINVEIKEINALNSQASEAMRRFDDIMGR